MTQRSIQAGWQPTVVVHAGGDVQVAGWDSDRVQAASQSRWGMKLERRGAAIEVHIGGSGEVFVPLGGCVAVYAGKSAEVRNINGRVTVYAGARGYIRGVDTLAHISTGRAMDIECERVEGQDVTFSAGGDLRCFVRQLANTRLLINDLGGYWEALIGDGRARLRLKAGGDVTLVTDQTVVAQPPHYVLGAIERPADT